MCKAGLNYQYNVYNMVGKGLKSPILWILGLSCTHLYLFQLVTIHFAIWYGMVRMHIVKVLTLLLNFSRRALLQWTTFMKCSACGFNWNVHWHMNEWGNLEKLWSIVMKLTGFVNTSFICLNHANKPVKVCHTIYLIFLADVEESHESLYTCCLWRVWQLQDSANIT